MDIGVIVNAVLGLAVLFGGGYFLKVRGVVKEVSETLAALQDVLTDVEGETSAEKLQDIKKLGKEAKEAFEAIRGLFKIKK